MVRGIETSPRKRVLLIDDEPSMLRLASRVLENAGYAVTVASNGLDGLREFEQERFDVVISDRQMPEMTGDELAEVIKSRAPEVPIILVSGYVGLIVNANLFTAFLPKPFTQKQLVAVVGEALRKTGAAV